MNNFFKILISILLLYIVILPIRSQNTSGSNDTIPVQHFNALDYSLQKRYKNKGETFSNNKFTDNMYITISGGMESLVKRGKTGFGTGPDFSFTIGKYLNRMNSLRATLSAGWYTRKEKDLNLTHTGIHFTHLFNISSYIYGYNPSRVFELSTFEGLGYQLSFLDGKKRDVGNLHFGLQLKVHPTSRMDILFEPRISFYTDGIDHSSGHNWHGFDVGYGGTIGFNYRFTPSGSGYKSAYLFKENSFFDNTFISLASGAQFPLSNEILSDIGFSNSLGSHFSITAGKWFIPMFGFQASLSSSFNQWGKNETSTRYLSSYNGGRIEGIFNILSFFNTDVQHLRFGFTGSVGIELARIHKETENYVDNIKHGYVGITGGIQLKYYTKNNVGLFIEPRFSQVSYPVYYSRAGIDQIIRQTYRDNVCAINFGIELRRATQEQRIESKNNSKEFTPSYFTGINGGFNILLTEEQFTKNTGYQFNIHGGRRFTPLSSFRVGVEYASYNPKEEDITIQSVHIPVDYLFNLTNYVSGYNKNRNFTTEFLAGILFSVPIDYSSKFRLGGETGFLFSYKITQKVNLQLESIVKIYGDKFIPSASVKGLNFIPSISLGAAYSF